MPLADKAVEVGAQLLEHTGLGEKAAEVLQGAAGRIMEEVGLTRAPRYVDDAESAFIHGGNQPRRPVNLADDPGRGVIAKVRITPEAPAKLVPGETLTTLRDRSNQVLGTAHQTNRRKLVAPGLAAKASNSPSNTVARATLSTGDVASVGRYGTMRVMTKEGFSGGLSRSLKDLSRIGSVRIAGPGIKASEPEFAFARGNQPSLSEITSGDKFTAPAANHSQAV